jgi:hypothetical protein
MSTLSSTFQLGGTHSASQEEQSVLRLTHKSIDLIGNELIKSIPVGSAFMPRELKDSIQPYNLSKVESDVDSWRICIIKQNLLSHHQ